MSLDKYQKAWEAESSEFQVTYDVDLLSKEVQRSHRSLQSTLFWRDVREVGTSLLTIPVWIVIGISLSLPWTWYLMVPASLWIAIFMLLDRKRHSQYRSEPGEPLMFYVKESLSQVEHQIWLLRNVFWWYLLPPSISIMAFFIHVALGSFDGWWGFVAFVGFLGLLLFIVYFAIYRLNQRAVRDQLEPRRIGLQTLITNLEGENAGAEEGELMSLAESLSGSDQNADQNLNWATWSENWNRIIPSWREVAIILVPTLVGGYCGYRFPLAQAGPVFFQAVVAAVIPFEIVFFSLWYLKSRRYKGQPLTATEIRRPGAPAIATIVMILVISALAIAAIFSFVSVRGPGLDDISEFNSGDIEYTDNWLQRLADSTYPSLSAVIVRDGEVVYQSTIGFENIESRKPATSTTPYHVASVTKVFTATVAALLHEKGMVDLDQAAITYLPANLNISTTPDVGARITLRQLASHTSGLPRRVPGQVQSVEGRYELEPQRLYDHLANVRLTSNPGDVREYSNLGFGLLGHVLERASGESLDELIQRMLCDPLRLESTGIQGEGELLAATGYGWRGERDGTENHSLQKRLAGSGGLVTSTDDLAKFLIAQMEPGVFSSEVLEQLHTETQLSGGSDSGTALGWRVRSVEEIGQILEKNGQRSNCSAWIGFSPEHKVAVAIITNCGGPRVDPMGRRLLTQSIPISAKKPPTDSGYAKVSPFTDVRFERKHVFVTFDENDYQWLEIDGIKVEDLIASSKRQFGSKWQMRVAEDLVEVLSGMGREPGDTVRLRLRNLETERDIFIESAPMTEENRRWVYLRRSRSAE